MNPVTRNLFVQSLIEQAGFVLWEDEPWGEVGTIDWSSDYTLELDRLVALLSESLTEKIYSAKIIDPADYDEVSMAHNLGYNEGLVFAINVIRQALSRTTS